MSVSLYINHRQDDSRRTGMYADGRRVMERFVDSGQEFNPALLWFVDVIWPDAPAPADDAAAVEWLRRVMPEVRATLTDVADRVRGRGRCRRPTGGVPVFVVRRWRSR